MDKSEIIRQLQRHHNAFTNLIGSLSQEEFAHAPADKWTAGQQLEHIYRSVYPLKMAFALPKLALKVSFGKANRPSRSYEELVAKYQKALAAGGRAGGKFVPEYTNFSKRERFIEDISKIIESICKSVASKSEEELDMYILPHPLIGKLTLREMLYFTIYHVQHHHKQVLQNLPQ